MNYLNLGDAPITDLTPLDRLANLNYLNLWEVPATDFTPLAGLANLSEIYVNGEVVNVD